MKVKSLVKRLWHSPYPLGQRRVAVSDAGHGGRTGTQKVLLLFSIIGPMYMCLSWFLFLVLYCHLDELSLCLHTDTNL